MRKLFNLLCVSLLLMSNMHVSKAENNILKDDNTYRVVDVNADGVITLVKEVSSYYEANELFKQEKDHYDNLCIAKGLNYLNCEYGVVAIASNDTCSLNSEYRNALNNTNGYTNGCYGGDASFIEYDASTNEVLFELSAVQGWIDADEVTIYPLSLVPNVTQYKVVNGKLYHYIKSNATSSMFTNILELSKAPTSLQNDTIYYSFDSHYFYDSYEKMIDDKRNNSHKNAVNDEPYYNYYQYVSHRTTSNYDYDAFHNYLTTSKGFNKTITKFMDEDQNNTHNILTQSLIMQGEKAFLHYQNQFGANAIMMLSLALNESNNGRSILAYERNNLFGHAAFDEAVAENASRYSSINDSIYSHAYHYINKSYGDIDAFQYHGGQFGNKAGGMNVQYASDPYWGEKAAQYYYQFDQANNELDYNQYAIGISGKKAMSVYSDPTSYNVLYTVKKGEEVSFMILEAIDDTYYKVQLDNSDAYNYSFKNDIAYIRQDDLSYVMNKDQIKAKEYITITFDANGGTYHPDKEIIKMDVAKGMIPSVLEPSKDDCLFVGYDQEITPASEEVTYKAQYQKIDNIKLVGDLKTTYQLNEPMDLSNASLQITLDDETRVDIDLTSDHISNFDSSKIGKNEVIIKYGNKQLTVEMQVVENIESNASSLRNEATKIIASYSEQAIDTNAMNQFNEFRHSIQQETTNPLSIDVIRAVDRIIQPTLNPRFSVIINDDQYDLQISGLSLAIKVEPIFVHKYAPATLKINLTNEIDDEKAKLFDQIASSNFLKLEDYLTFSGSVDFNEFNPKIELAYSLKKPQGSENKLFRVLSIDQDGNVIMLPTYQSESRILFKGKADTYALCSMEVNGLEGSFDFTEVNLQPQNGKDYLLLGVYVPAIAMIAALVFLLILIIIIIKLNKRKKARRS